MSKSSIISSLEWIYREFGDPAKVLKLQERQLKPLEKNTVYLQFLASPVNPSDLAQIEGVYPTKGRLREDGTTVAGNEGVAKVIAAGEQVSKVKIGDWVIPRTASFGTWRTHAEASEDELTVLSPGLSVEEAATIFVNPPTALRMLEDFVDLKEGSVVVQNAANSIAGQAVIQMAKLRNIYTVNVIRDRPEFDELAQKLKNLGANEVLREGDLKERKLEADLALNCVGGASATDLASSLKNAGVMVTYGSMSRQPVRVSGASFIFKDIILRGFWLTRWKRNASARQNAEMLSTIQEMYKNKQLCVPPTARINIQQLAENLPPATKLLMHFSDN